MVRILGVCVGVPCLSLIYDLAMLVEFAHDSYVPCQFHENLDLGCVPSAAAYCDNENPCRLRSCIHDCWRYMDSRELPSPSNASTKQALAGRIGLGAV